ncbi:MAG: serine/threonine protein kinase, partial [Actinobacteria bacterium]
MGPPIAGPTGYVYWLAYSADGHTLAAGVTDNTVWLWDVSRPRQPTVLATLESATNAVYTIGYAPHGHVLAASGSDTTVRMWDPDPNRVAEWICA